MKNKWQRTLILMLVTSLLLVTQGVCWADAANKILTEKEELVALLEIGFVDYDEPDLRDSQVLQEVMKDPEKYLYLHEKSPFGEVYLFNTEDENCTIAVTDGKVEIVRYLGEDRFSINGEVTRASSNVIRNDVEPSGWEPGNDPGGSYGNCSSYYRDYDLEKPIMDYTIGALSAVIGALIGGGVGTALGFYVASQFITYCANNLVDTNEGQSYITECKHLTNPNLYKRVKSRNSLMINGSSKPVGTVTKYLHWIPGGP